MVHSGALTHKGNIMIEETNTASFDGEQRDAKAKPAKKEKKIKAPKGSTASRSDAFADPIGGGSSLPPVPPVGG